MKYLAVLLVAWPAWFAWLGSARAQASEPSVAEQALGAEVMACVQSRVALRAEVIGLQHAAALGKTPEPTAPPKADTP
jgi:hypothetical protein